MPGLFISTRRLYIKWRFDRIRKKENATQIMIFLPHSCGIRIPCFSYFEAYSDCNFHTIEEGGWWSSNFFQYGEVMKRGGGVFSENFSNAWIIKMRDRKRCSPFSKIFPTIRVSENFSLIFSHFFVFHYCGPFGTFCLFTVIIHVGLHPLTRRDYHSSKFY